GVVLATDALFTELSMLEERGVPARERLGISEACPLILPYHVALDAAREKARGKQAIGTTGRGIGPAYEDKVARRALRVADLLYRERLAAKLGEVLDYHNFVLVNYYKQPAQDFQAMLDACLAWGEQIAPMIVDVSQCLSEYHRRGEHILFEGAQGTLLDIDHGSYPYVTSSNTTAGFAATGSGVGPCHFDYVLGITKAYTTRVGSGPFPTELFDEFGDHLAERGHEFGATTGRPRRCGWFDAVALRRSSQINSLSGLCMTKLDVLDGLESIQLCVGYTVDGRELDVLPVGAEAMEAVEPRYEELPGWSESTVGVRRLDDLPANARAYLERIEAVTGVPIHIVSTGPDRADTIIIEHPFD
ncbi:MAG: adenylosuccinate synthase, partial [Gammaproteobacteria bacterium]|nr:adenylosuccinate synthase [Gammaproteobacteria bacterium]